MVPLDTRVEFQFLVLVQMWMVTNLDCQVKCCTWSHLKVNHSFADQESSVTLWPPLRTDLHTAHKWRYNTCSMWIRRRRGKNSLNRSYWWWKELARNYENAERLIPDSSFKGYTRGREGIQVFVFHVTVKQNLFIYI